MALLFEQFRTSEVRDFNPDTGAVLVKTYEGTAAQITAIEAYWAQLNFVDDTPTGRGYKTVRTDNPQKSTLVVRVPDDILYTDRWAVDTETISVPIWWSSTVRTYIGFPIVAVAPASQVALDVAFSRQMAYINACVAAIGAGTDPTLITPISDPNYNVLTIVDALNPGSDPTASARIMNVIYTILREGGYVEWKRPVLKRNRTIPFSVSGSTSLVGPMNIYTTAGLISAIGGMPAAILSKISDVELNLPSPPAYTIWGWKQRRNDEETQIGYARTIECVDWVFGLWSKLTHTFVS